MFLSVNQPGLTQIPFALFQARDCSVYRTNGAGNGEKGQKPTGAEVLFRQICKCISVTPVMLPKFALLTYSAAMPDFMKA